MYDDGWCAWIVMNFPCLICSNTQGNFFPLCLMILILCQACIHWAKTPDSTDCRYVSTAGGDPRNPSWGSNTTIAASSSPALEARSSVQPRLGRTMTHIQVYKSSGFQKSEGKSFKVADWRKHSAQLGRGQLPVPPNFLLDCEVAPSCIYPCEGGNDPGNCARGWFEQVFKSADTEWIWSSAGHLWNTCDTD